MEGYYKIDKTINMYGTWELWESLKYGDEDMAMVTLNGRFHGYTWDSLYDYVDDYLGGI